MDYEVRTTADVDPGLNVPKDNPDGPMCEPPVPDAYKLDALDLISNLQSYDNGYRIEYLKGTVERAARWLMERDKKWQSR